MAKVSVIIPVYNTAPFLSDAVGSVFNQSLREIEIVVINDGSTDNSLEVLNELAQTDERMIIISHETNMGLSAARNTGLSAATGDFIYFFDSDDRLESDCLELCYLKMISGNYDFLLFDGISFTEDGTKAGFTANYQRTNLMTCDSYVGSELINMLIRNKNYSTSVCLLFIRKEFLLKNKLDFYPGVLFEDVLFTARLYLAAKSVTSVSRTFFHRRIRQNSIVTSKISQLNVNSRLIVGRELLDQRKFFPEKQEGRILKHQCRNLYVFLVKSLLRSHQFGLLFRNFINISKMIVKSL